LQSSRAKNIACLVDTDIAIDFLRRRDYARKLLERWAGEGLLAISTLTHLEIYQGMKADEEEATNAFLDGLTSIPVDVPISRKAGRILGELRSKGMTVGIADAIIAATALQLDAPLLTNNVEHYPFANLKLIRGLKAKGHGQKDMSDVEKDGRSCMSGVNDTITNLCTHLEKAGVQGIPLYKQRLMANSTSDNFQDFLLEGRTALMFRQAGFHVTFGEAPDLALEFNGEQLYAEVKHFRRKRQDLIDDARMSERGDELEPYGDTVPLEGKPAWEQVYDVARNKIRQYKEHAPNILVVESSSPNCIDDLIIPTVVDMIDEDVHSGRCSGLGRLNGILLVSLGQYNISRDRMVFFWRTGKPDVLLSQGIGSFLDRIRLG
jgi:predicted nucleic acid-binding protein